MQATGTAGGYDCRDLFIRSRGGWCEMFGLGMFVRSRHDLRIVRRMSGASLDKKHPDRCRGVISFF